MPTVITLPDQYADTFNQLTLDDKLAALWHIYGFICSESAMKEPNNNTAPDSSNELFNRAQELSADKQLELMRNLLAGADTELTQEYNKLTNTTRLAFWYQLAQGMERSDIVQVPDDYQMSDKAQSLVSDLEPIGFEQQYAFLRSVLLSDNGKPSV